MCPCPSCLPRQQLFQPGEEFLPAMPGAVVGLRLVGPEARLFHAQAGSRRDRRQRPGHHAVEAKSSPGVGQCFVRLDDAHFAGDDAIPVRLRIDPPRSEEHTSELQSLMRISYAVFCLKKNKTNKSNGTKCDNRTFSRYNVEQE